MSQMCLHHFTVITKAPFVLLLCCIFYDFSYSLTGKLSIPYRLRHRVARLMTVIKFNDFLRSLGSFSKGRSGTPTVFLFVDAQSICQRSVTVGTALHHILLQPPEVSAAHFIFGLNRSNDKSKEWIEASKTFLATVIRCSPEISCGEHSL